MINIFRKKISDKKIKEIEQSVISAVDDGQYDIAWENIQPLLSAQEESEEVVLSIIKLIDKDCLSVERSLEVLSNVFQSHKSKIHIVSKIGSSLEYARDIDQLNLEPSDHPLFQEVVGILSVALDNGISNDEEEEILDGLSTAARMMSRQHDSIAEKSYKRRLEIDPGCSSYHYGYGLYCKTRGLFREGVIANKKAMSLVKEPVESYQWNLGICATGAREGELALDVWKKLGNKIEMGRFDLPEGGYPSCKVRLSQFPLAERSAENDFPGVEETIWIERLSPCHGIIRSVLYQDLGVDYGDVVLMDGAPITYHTYGDDQIAVFPHLATLEHNNYQFFNFAAVQKKESQIDGISSSLERDAVVYSHTENFQILCSTCWRDSSIDHHDHNKEEKYIVTGRISAPPDMKVSDLLVQIDNAINQLDGCSIYAPELCKASGLHERADVELRRYDMLVDSQ